MNHRLTVVVVGLVFALITVVVKNHFEKIDKLYDEADYVDQVFKYAKWARGIEVFGFLFFGTLITLLLLFVAEYTSDYIIFSSFLLLIILTFIYRYFAWNKETIRLEGYELIYKRGLFRQKETRVHLNDIESFDIDEMRYYIKLKGRKKRVMIPMGFEREGLIYSILKNHRARLEDDEIEDETPFFCPTCGREYHDFDNVAACYRSHQ